MTSLTGGDAVCEALEAIGVECVFGIPSQQNLGLYEALYRRGRIRHVGVRHEAGAVHAADGYARATGRLGVAIVSTGPGTANAMNGLYEAGFASSPVLLLTTQVDRVHLGRGRGFIHDADGQLPMLRSVTRRSERVLHWDHIADVIVSVVRDIMSGKPQPGAVELPTDLLTETRPRQGAFHVARPLPIAPDLTALQRALKVLESAKRPLLWVGGGCIRADAAEAVRTLVRRLGIPVVSSLNGRGVLPSDDPLSVGSQTHTPVFRELLQEADAVLAVGTRFQAYASANWTLPMPSRLVHIDVDGTSFGKNFIPEVAVLGDARVAIEWLVEHIRPPLIDSDFLALAQLTRTRLAAGMEDDIGPDHGLIADVIDRVLPKERNIVCDATMAAVKWGSHRLSVHEPGQFLYSTSLAIGPALPLGIGAAIGSGRKTVVIHGDGGIMLSIGELATAAQENADIIVLVFNDRCYGLLGYIQEMQGIPKVAVDLHAPDFVSLGKAMGIPSWKVRASADFETAFVKAVEAQGPQLIEIDLTDMVPMRL